MTDKYTFDPNGNIPEDEMFFAAESLGKAWPRIVARAWSCEIANINLLSELKRLHSHSSKCFDSWADENKSIVEEVMRKNTGPEHKADLIWYRNLFSNDDKLVRQAFSDEGLYVAASRNAKHSIESSKTRIRVIPFGVSYKLHIPSANCQSTYSSIISNDKKNGWVNVRGIDNFVVFSMPARPDDDEELAVSFANYLSTGKTYVFTCCC